jgi:hypothetical protein
MGCYIRFYLSKTLPHERSTARGRNRVLPKLRLGVEISDSASDDDKERQRGRWQSAGVGGVGDATTVASPIDGLMLVVAAVPPTWGSGIAGVPTAGWTYKAVGVAQRQGWRGGGMRRRRTGKSLRELMAEGGRGGEERATVAMDAGEAR